MVFLNFGIHLDEIKLEITNQCFLSCIHCSTNSCTNNASFLSLSNIENIIRQAQALGANNISLSGGEPLLYPDLKQVIEMIANYGCRSTIYTSGIAQIHPMSPMSIDYLKSFKSLNLSNLIFSIYSHKSENHDAITGVDGSFYTTLTSLENALHLGLETEVHFVALKPIIDDLMPLVKFLEKIGIKKISVLRFVPQGRGKNNSYNLLPDTKDFVKLSKVINSIRKDKTIIECRTGSPFNFLLLKKPTPCNSGRTRMIIDAEGFAYPCDALKQFKSKGLNNNNINFSSLTEIIQTGNFFRLIREAQLPDECLNCACVKKCMGGCLAQRYLGDVKYRDPACLLLTQKEYTSDKIFPHTPTKQGHS